MIVKENKFVIKGLNLNIIKKNFLEKGINFILRQLRVSLNAYEEKFLIDKKIDTIIEIGGSLFMELDKIPKYRKMINFQKRELIKYNLNYYILGANFGAYKTKEFFDIYYNFFEKCKDISFREKYSYDLFKDLPNVRYNNDIIFSLKLKKKFQETEYILISVIKPSRKPETNKKDKQYYDTIKRITLECLENDKEVKLMSFCKNEGDEEAIEEILKIIPDNFKNKVKKYYYRGDIEEALEVIGKAEAIVATRFHAMILGFIFKKKVYPIAYSKKITNVLEDLKFNGNYCSFDNLNQVSYERIIENQKLNENVLELAKKDAERHFEKLDLFLKEEK